MINLRLFGYPTVWQDGEQVTGFISEKALAVLVFTAVTQETHARDYLAGLFWGDVPEQKAKSSLRSALYSINQLLPDALLLTRRTVALAAPIGTDVQQLMLQNDPAVYKADFLSGFYLPNAPEFEQWQLRQRERLRQVALTLWQEAADAYETAGDIDGGINALRQQLNIEAWHETAHVRLMRLLARQGSHDAALRQFKQCQQSLQAGLGVEPAPETRQLAQQIRMARRLPRHNLPPVDAPLFGREALLGKLAAEIEAQRLVTLLGVGGMGKTRLALALGQRVQNRFLHGVAFVPLVGVSAGGGVNGLATAVFRTLVRARFVSPSRDDAAAALCSQLAQREMLLILDNIEHLLDGVLLLDRLLNAAPQLHILVTSRQQLRLTQERPFPLQGLAQPAAVSFFVTAARQRQPAFVADPHVNEFCRRVEGMPLAIELAGGLVDQKRPAQLVSIVSQQIEQLENSSVNRAPRHQNVRLLFAESVNQLSIETRQKLVQLAVFQGVFTKTAAFQVAAADGETLRQLIEHALLRREADGYSLHPLLRRFCDELVQDRKAHHLPHARFVGALLTSQRAALEGGDQMGVLDTLATWEDDMVAALRWLVGGKRWPLLNEMLLPFFLYFEMQTRYAELLSLLQLLGTNVEATAGELYGRFLTYLAWTELMLEIKSDTVQQIEPATRQLAPADRAQSLLTQAVWFNDQLDFAKAYALATEAFGLAAQAENGRIMNRATTLMANCTIPARLNRPDEGKRLYARAIEIARMGEDKRGLSISLHNYGFFLFYSEQYAEAERVLRETAVLHNEMRQPISSVMSQMLLARAVALQGRYGEALRTIGSALHEGQQLQATVPLLQLLTVAATEIFPKVGQEKAGATLQQFLQYHPALTEHLRVHLAETAVDAPVDDDTGWSLGDAVAYAIRHIPSETAASDSSETPTGQTKEQCTDC